MPDIQCEITLTGDVTNTPMICVIPDDAFRKRYPGVNGIPANSYTCPVGQASGRAWLVMRRGDLDTLTTPDKKGNTDSSYTLSMKAFRTNNDEFLSFPELLIIKAARLSIGEPDDADSPYVVELADKRYLLERWSDTGVILSNIRSHAQDTDFLTGTTGAGTEKTWDELAEELWDTMSDILGAYDQSVLAERVPEGWDLRGENAWYALNRIVSLAGYVIAYNPLAATYSIVGTAQSIPSAYELDLLRDAEPIEHNASRFPETIRVYFRSHYRSYGQERDTELGTNWQVEPSKATTSVDVATNIAGAITGTVLPLWDTLAAVFTEDGADENSLDRTQQAQVRAVNWLFDAGLDRALKSYAGFKSDVLPGNIIKEIRWENRGFGSITIIRQRPGFTRRVAIGGAADGQTELTDIESGEEGLQPPDLSRGTFPNFPRLPNIVEVDDGSSPAGELIAPNGSGLFPGFVYRWVAGVMTELEPCWVRPVDLASGGAPSEATVISLRRNDKYVGRLSGIETHSGDTRPIYLVRSGETKATLLNACIDIAFSAYDGWSSAVEVLDMRELTFASNSSLQLYEPDAGPDGTAMLAIQAGPLESIFWSDEFDIPKWHTSPRIRQSLDIGHDSTHYLGLADNLKLQAGMDETQTIKFPTTRPVGIDTYLYVSALSGTGSCIQTEWGPQGITGNFYVYAADCEDSPICKLIEVTKGLVTGITGVEPPASGDQGSVDCTTETDAPFDPCS